jgi:putative hemolysin
VLRLFGDRTSFVESRISPDELMQLLEEAGRAGNLDSGAADIAVRSIEFAGLTAGDVMVPRNRVVAIERTATADDVRRAFLDKGHARLPVYDDNLDQVVGYITAKDVLTTSLDGQPLLMDELVRPATFFPESMRAVAVLREMQKRHANLAIIVDELGGTAGILTTEDLIEELVGELFSEDERGVPAPVRQRADGTALVLGSVTVRDLNRSLDLALPEDERYTTIAGYVIAVLGRIPESGERITTSDGTILEILESTPRRIRALRIKKPEPEPEAAPKVKTP